MKYIKNYDPNWSREFLKLRDFLKNYLPDNCIIHHIGSTSIPDMPAKDIIDIDIECPKGSMKNIIRILDKAGYIHEGDIGIKGREAFKPKHNSPALILHSHHLYACESGAHELIKHLAYRDYLINNKERALWIAKQKIIADKNAESRSEYIDNKSDSYAAITEEALKWYKRL